MQPLYQPKPFQTLLFLPPWARCCLPSQAAGEASGPQVVQGVHGVEHRLLVRDGPHLHERRLDAKTQAVSEHEKGS